MLGLGYGTQQQSGRMRLVRDEVHKGLGVLTQSLKQTARVPTTSKTDNMD